jgi:hypothetical protein
VENVDAIPALLSPRGRDILQSQADGLHDPLDHLKATGPIDQRDRMPLRGMLAGRPVERLIALQAQALPVLFGLFNGFALRALAQGPVIAPFAHDSLAGVEVGVMVGQAIEVVTIEYPLPVVIDPMKRDGTESCPP